VRPSEGVAWVIDNENLGVQVMMKKWVVFAFGLAYSMVAFGSFTGQTVQVEWLLDAAVMGTISIPAPGSATFAFDATQSCVITVNDAQIAVDSCVGFTNFGNCGGGCTFNGFRFTQLGASPPAITAVTPPGTVVDANSILANLIGLSWPVTLDVTFAAPVVNRSQPIPVLAPLGLWLFGLLLAGVSYRAHRRR
jgi:hypothetical protein